MARHIISIKYNPFKFDAMNVLKLILMVAHVGFQTRTQAHSQLCDDRVLTDFWLVLVRDRETLALVILNGCCGCCYWLLDLIVVLRLCFDRGRWPSFALFHTHKSHKLIHIHKSSSRWIIKKINKIRIGSFSYSALIHHIVSLRALCLRHVLCFVESIECVSVFIRCVRAALALFLSFCCQWHSHYVD